MKVFLILLAYLALVMCQSCPAVPCPAGQCCSVHGYCGTTSAYCGAGNCASNCWTGCKLGGSNSCPATECCSQYGYCGTTDAYCSPANFCFSNCKSPSTSSYIFAAYIPSWMKGYTAPCNLNLNTLNAAKFTHLLVPFAVFDTTNFVLTALNGDDTSGWYSQVQGLKSRNANLKVLISVGGGDFGPAPFATMASTATNRNKFISNAISFARRNNFDGIDIDWEAPDSTGQTAQILALFTSFRAAINSESQSSGKAALLLTIASPNYQYAINLFNFPIISQYLDFINVMNYDYYGPWSTVIGANSDFSGVTATFAAFANVPPNKLVMGFANYARTYTLRSASQNTPGSPFSGPGTKGSCTSAAGTLNYNEVSSVIAANPSGVSVFDSASKTPYFYYGNQWITYDNTQSLQIKVDYLKSKGYRGAMLWALDGNPTVSNFVATSLGL